MSSIFVTGATGFIGRHLVRRLVHQGHKVRCLVRATSNTSKLEGLDIEFVSPSILDTDGLTKAVDGCETVYHLAGMTCAFKPSDLMRVNGEGCAALAEACRRQSQPPLSIVVSSLSAAGPSRDDNPKIESMIPAPMSDYGKSKRAGEIEFETLAADVPTTIVRPAIVFGEENEDMLPMFRTIKRMGLHAAPGWRAKLVSLIDVKDLVDLILLAAERGKRIVHTPGSDEFDGSGYYFAADAQFVRYSDLGRMIGQSVGRKKVRVVPVPPRALWTIGLFNEQVSKWKGRPNIVNRDKAREGLAGNWICSNEQAVQELGYQPEYSLQQRLDQTAEWYRDAGWL